ncbi:MAG: RDD family protein, partial [Burkholderiaceae bacterium]
HPWRRFMGMVYEGIILFGVLWFADYVFSALTRFDGSPGTLRHVFQAFQFLVLGCYFIGFWRRGLRTLPMKTLSLQVTDREGRSLTTGRAALRYLVGVALLLAALALAKWVHGTLVLLVAMPWAWSLIDPDRQGLHDRLAGTRLVTWDPVQDR